MIRKLKTFLARIEALRFRPIRFLMNPKLGRIRTVGSSSYAVDTYDERLVKIHTLIVGIAITLVIVCLLFLS